MFLSRHGGGISLKLDDKIEILENGKSMENSKWRRLATVPSRVCSRVAERQNSKVGKVRFRKLICQGSYQEGLMIPRVSKN